MLVKHLLKAYLAKTGNTTYTVCENDDDYHLS